MSFFFRKRTTARRTGLRRHRALKIERLEDRTVLSAFAVTNLNDHGAGSLRQAMLNANSTVGADTINFNVAGIIKLTSGALPAVTDNVNIDGTTAPGFAGAPRVEVDYNGFGGLQFQAAAAGSALESLALVHSSGAGIKLNGGGHILIAGNYIGLALNGNTVAANKGNGIELVKSVSNTIGGVAAADRNVVSGNRKNGIYVNGGSSNQILGNYIGSDSTGALDRGNAGSGVVLTGGSQRNTIGGLKANAVSGNDGNGIEITSKATLNTVSANIVGLTAAGNTALANSNDGVKLDSANNNLIGQSDPVRDITYHDASLVSTQPVSGWQGIRGAAINGHYLIAGTSDADGLLFDGTIDGVGQSYVVDFPNAYNTSVYGPDNLAGATCVWLAATRMPTMQPRRSKSTAFCSRDSRRLGHQQQLPNDRLSRREIQLCSQHDGRPGRGQLRQPDRTRPIRSAVRAGACIHLRHFVGHVFDRRRLPRLQEQHGLRHLVQRRHQLHDLRRVQFRSGEQFQRSKHADRQSVLGRLRLADRHVLELDNVRLSGRNQLRHAFRRHQQRRKGSLHAQRRFGADGNASRLKARGSRCTATPTVHSARRLGSI